MELHGVTGDIRTDGILSSELQEELDRSQVAAAESVKRYLVSSNYQPPYPLVIKPTGYGKSRIVDLNIRDLGNGDLTFLIVGTKEILIDQNQESLKSLVHEETGEDRFSILPNLTGPVVLTTWQGLDAFERGRKNEELPKVGLALVDEAHNAGTARRIRLLKRLNPKMVVGYTATGYRASGKFREPESYGFYPLPNVVSTLPECIDKQWLSPLMGLCIDTRIILPRNVLTGQEEINAPKLYRELRHHPNLFSSIAHEVGTRYLPTGMKTIIVVNRVMEEACLIYMQLERMGFKVGLAINEQASRELEGMYNTRNTIERYKLPHGHPDALQVLISPQVIGEGFDAPATECIVWAAPTCSSLRYTQVMGRGARRCPGKKYCLIVDFVYQIEGYGYSMNFAQFFRKSEMKNLRGGFLYVGPDGNGSTMELPEEFTKDAYVVSIVDLQRQVVVEHAGEYLTRRQIRQSLDVPELWFNNVVVALGISSESRISQNGRPSPHYSPENVERLKEFMSWKNYHEVGRVLGLEPRIAQRRAEHVMAKGRVKLRGPLKCGHITYCSPELIEAVRLTLQYQTGRAICAELGVSGNWVKFRLPLAMSSLGSDYDEIEYGNLTLYSPKAVEFLRDMKDWVTSGDIARESGFSWTQTSERIAKYLEANPTARYRTVGNTPYYSPEVKKEILEMPRLRHRRKLLRREGR